MLKLYYVFMNGLINKIKIYFLLKKLNKAAFDNIFMLNVAGANNFGDDLMAQYIFQRLSKINKNVYQLVDINNQSVNKNLINLGLKIKDINFYKPKKDLVIIGSGTLINPLVFPNDFFIQKAEDYLNRAFKVAFLGIKITDMFP